jgi:hypothetical protein
MRTTLTIEPDVAQQIRRRMAQTGHPLRRVINDALRIGLSSDKKTEVRFKVEPHSFGFKPGIDSDKLNQLVDDLETEEFLKRSG